MIVFVLIILLLVLTVVIIENISGGMGHMQMSIPWHLSTIVDGGQAQ